MKKCTIWYINEVSKVQAFTSSDFSESKLALIKALSDQLIAGGVNQSLRKLAESVGTSHRVLLYHFEDRNQLLRETLLYINEVVVLRLETAEVPNPCTPHDLMKLISEASRGIDIFYGGLWFEIIAQSARGTEPFVEIAREIEGNWSDILLKRLELKKGEAMGLLASTEGLAVLQAVLGKSTARSASF